ncbi:MAG: hypothetical protein WKF87_06845 [Chryseolinea sp.]
MKIKLTETQKVKLIASHNEITTAKNNARSAQLVLQQSEIHKQDLLDLIFEANNLDRTVMAPDSQIQITPDGFMSFSETDASNRIREAVK